MFKMEDWPKLRAEVRQHREEAYKRESPEICKVYHLDAERDRDQVEKLIKAVKELNACTVCEGGECQKKGGKAYTKPQIEHDEKHGYHVRYGDCPVIVRRRKLAKAEKQLPRRYVCKTFEDYEPTAANERAIALGYQFLATGQGSLYYHGCCGTGKTFLATLIAKEWLSQGKALVFGDMPTLLDRIKKTFNDPQASSQQIIDEYGGCELLILDDVGTGVISDWSVNVLYQVVNARYNAERPMILTSNYDLEGLERRLGSKDAVASARIVSRLKQLCKVASLGKHDRRQDR